MKRIIFLVILFSLIFGSTVSATPPFNTYTRSVDFTWTETQQAYEAISFISSAEIRSPQDLFIDSNNYLYVADSSTRQIIVLNENREIVRLIGRGELTAPTGVTVNQYGEIFVADRDYVVIFCPEGELLNRFGRPDSPLFGATAAFRPLKLAVNSHGVIFIAGEAAHNGLIMLGYDGEFLGYFGANQTVLTLFQILQNTFTPRDRRHVNVPLPPTSVAIDDRGAVFTVTNGLLSERVKKLNVTGNNILPNVTSTLTTIDIAMAHHGGFFVLDTQGIIIEYNSEGWPIFSFGFTDPAVQRMGVFLSPTSIAQDNYGNLFVADGVSGLIHFFAPTEFARWVHMAMYYFDQGLYTESMAYWEEVLRFHSGFSLANMAIGQALFLKEDFTSALHSFYVARYVTGYSEAFWELRNDWMILHAGSLIVGVFALWLIFKGLRGLRGDKENKTQWRITPHPILQELAHVKKVLRSPVDAFYEIRFHNKASVKSATIMYVLLLVAYFISIVGRGFVFTETTLLSFFFSVPMLMLIFVSAVALFVVVNYLVATINEGEGSFKNVYICTAYSSAPYILLSVPATIISRVLTLNENFVFSFAMQIAVVWSFVLVFLMIKELHDYEIGAVIKNIILTVFTAGVLIVTGFVLYLLVGQVIEFALDIVMEVGVRG